MADVESKFKISAQASGFQSLTRAAEKLTKAFDALGEAGERMGRRTAAGLGLQQGAMAAVAQGAGIRLGRAGGSAGTFSTAGNAAERIGQAGRGGGGAGGSGGGGGRGRRRGIADDGGSGRARGSFTQGLLQGALPESFIERGPGAYQQAGGVLAGRFARRTLGAAADLVTASSQGPNAVASALGSIPVVGGVLANSLGAGIQAARGEISAQSGFAGLLPYINQRDGGFSDRLNPERERLGALGRQFGGMSMNRSLATFGAAAAQSGVVTRDVSDTRLGRALQAQQGYGVDLATSLRLLRGEDTGQALGGRGANSLNAALGNAQGLGLQGSEIGGYLRRMAADLEEVNRTGIKFSATGQGDLERALGRGLVGVAGTRTAELGQSLSAGINSLTQGGPQNSAQAMLMQAAGYNPEQPNSAARALRRLEDPTQRASLVSRAVRRMRSGSQGFSQDQQAELYRRFMGQFSVNLTHTEAYDAVRSGAVDQMGAGSLPGAPIGDTQLAAQARANTPYSAQREARLADTDTRVGMQQMDAVQTADESAKRFTTSVQGVGNTFLNAANSIADVGRQLANFTMSAAGVGGSETAFR